MDNPVLLPIFGALAIALLLLVVLVLRRRRHQASVEGEQEPGDPESESFAESFAGDQGDEDPWASLDGPTDPDWADLDPADEEPWVPCGVDADDDSVEEEEPWVPCAVEPTDAPTLDAAPFSVDTDTTSTEPLEADAVFDAPQSRESVDIRSLKAQVRTLEEALGKLQEEEASAGGPADDAAEQQASFRRQLRATMRGLGQRTREDEAPERTLARVAAAMERLDAPDDLVRTVLPTVAFDLEAHRMVLAGSRHDERLALPSALIQAIGAPASAPTPSAHVVPAPMRSAESPVAHVAQVAVEQPPVELPVLVDAAPEPAPEPAPVGAVFEPSPDAAVEPHPQSEPEPEHLLPPPPDPDLVLPVPPPASVQPQRQRRWGRHGA